MPAVNLNGVKIAYEKMGKGTPLVLLHGYPLDHAIWQPVIPWLEGHAELILPDLRGFGASRSSADGYSIVDMASDVAALLDDLKIEKAAVAGHSMGGYVSLAFATQFPGRILGLGLVASQAGADSPERRQGRYDTAQQVKARGVEVVAGSMPAKLTSNPDLQKDLQAIVRRQSVEGIVGALMALAGRPDFTPSLSHLGFPVSIVHGLEDGLIPIERAREVQAAVPQGYMVELKAVGHMPMMEAPRSTAEALKTLL